MKVILLDDVAKLGRRGEVRDVSDGYARNFLIPKKLALSATAGNLKNLEHIKKQANAKAERIKSDAEDCGRAPQKTGKGERAQARAAGGADQGARRKRRFNPSAHRRHRTTE